MILDDESSFSDSGTTDGLLLEYPEPFKGNYGDNVHDFIEKVESALNYNRVPASSKVTVLKKLVKGGRAEWSVYDWESLDDNFERLKNVFGDPYIIWKKTKDDFLQRSREEIVTGPIILRLKEKRCCGKCLTFWQRQKISRQNLNLSKGKCSQMTPIKASFQFFPTNLSIRSLKR